VGAAEREAVDHAANTTRSRSIRPASRPSRVAAHRFTSAAFRPTREAAAISGVYLTWPDTESTVADIIVDRRARAAAHGRSVKLGYRAHVVVRGTEAQARTTADGLLSHLDVAKGAAIRAKSRITPAMAFTAAPNCAKPPPRTTAISSSTYGPASAARARAAVRRSVIGDRRSRSGNRQTGRYQALGIEAFILSGYPQTSPSRTCSRGTCCRE